MISSITAIIKLYDRVSIFDWKSLGPRRFDCTVFVLGLPLEEVKVMETSPKRLVMGLSLLLIAAGCIATKVDLVSTKAEGVERIPEKVGLYPLFSTPVGRSGVKVMHRPLSLKRYEGNVVITPPTETELLITQESQIMTGLISTQLASAGFSLKELPVEVLPENNDDSSQDGVHGKFAISLNLLHSLRENYGLEALVIGNVFFVVEMQPGAPPEKRIVSAHLRIIDIQSLDVLGQVSLPYDAHGQDMNKVADEMALALAEMAGLEVE